MSVLATDSLGQRVIKSTSEMPLSAVCVSVITERSRAWRSRPQTENVVKSTTSYCESYNIRMTKKSEKSEYEFLEDKPPKKDKKWSISNFFRRKKKNESSSDDERDKAIFHKKKQKPDKKNKSVPFDHVVLTNDRASVFYPNMSQYSERFLPSIPICSDYNQQIVYEELTNTALTNISTDNLHKRKKETKTRAEARRTSLSHNSSSEDESQHSNSSRKFRSDDNLTRNNHRRSRAARTERYLKRHSKDSENSNNYLRVSRSDTESFLRLSDDSYRSPSRSPTTPNQTKLSYSSLCSQSPSVSTIPPSHVKYRVCNSTSNSSYKPPLSINEYNNRKLYPLSCDNNIIQAKLPTSKNLHYPPPPPPRDVKSVDSIFKSISEDHLPRNDSYISLTQRPSSALPELLDKPRDNYQYLMDKQPRSRKPIFIQKNVNTFHTKEQNSLKRDSFLNLLKAKKNNRPLQIKNTNQVENKLFLPSVLPTDNNVTKIENVKKSSNLEEALDELEIIYKSLKLGDEELLERAEQRESDEINKRLIENGRPINRFFDENLSDSVCNSKSYSTLNSRKRFSLVKSDDMAFRKLQKSERSATISDPQYAASRISYMLSSPVYNNNVADDDEINGEPNVTKDDVLYRSILQCNKLKVPEVQPPFGIPLGPIAHAANSDYLHVVPDSENNTQKPCKIPDLVKDDLAYRSLRKDKAREAALPPLLLNDSKNNNVQEFVYNPPKFELFGSRKKRAVRSKSANIGSLISREVIERAARRNASLDNENNFKTLTDIADAMEVARQVLKSKEEKICDTRKASMSDTDACIKYVRYSKVFPEREVKESTPIPLSRLEDSPIKNILRTTSFEDALTALAIEAKNGSDKITRELNNLDNMTPKLSSEILDKEVENMLELSNSDEGKSSKVDHEHDNINDIAKGEVFALLSTQVNVECVSKNLELLENLESPRLVLETSRRRDNDAINGLKERRHIPDDVEKFGVWHCDATTMAVACSYGLACATQMAYLDLFSILSIIFAVLTFIAALFI